MSGHVFVIQGDLMDIACDAWLVPGGRRPGADWRRAVLPVGPALPSDWGEWDGPRVVRWPATAEGPNVPEPFLTHVAGTNRHTPEWHVAGARAFVQTASAAVKQRLPFHGRAKHLLALPLVGTGHGGAAHVAGGVVRLLLGAMVEEARAHDVDLVLVLHDGPAFAAVQNERRRAGDELFGELSPGARAAADALADKARSGDLVLFVGAGVSQGAGLPSWDDLLADLAADRAPRADPAHLGRLGELDRAALISRRLGHDESLGALVAEHLAARSSRYALGHGLLASVPADEVITTNYDDLFERASRAAGRAVTVLPGGKSARGQRWLLKMHGCVTRPETIVLTREDYLRFQENRSALAGIVQALLITRHMLFVGFSFSDDNFHRIAHAVRQAMRQGGGEASGRFGTTLVVNPNPLARELWEDDVAWLTFHAPSGEGPPRGVPEQIRQVEIFLDRLASRAATTAGHLCDPRYEAVLSPAELELRGRLLSFVESAGPAVRATPAWGEISRMLQRLGAKKF